MTTIFARLDSRRQFFETQLKERQMHKSAIGLVRWVAAILVLVGPNLLIEIDHANSKPVTVSTGHYTKAELQKHCSLVGGNFDVRDDGAYSCANSETGLATNCDKSGHCVNSCTSAKLCGASKTAGGNGKIDPNGGAGNTTKIPGTTNSGGAAVGTTLNGSGTATSSTSPTSTPTSAKLPPPQSPVQVGGAGKPPNSSGGGIANLKQK